ncbi:MAG: bacillithiol biosynthesis BshC [Lewinellaceae bacterium]|nr:bacillithiol biosynthesis BshC [Lewinellaceae bacterium]
MPNLAYVGGGGELAYWLERKALFAHFKVPFPMLVRRHSVLWLDKDAVNKLEKFGFDAAAFFGETESLESLRRKKCCGRCELASRN